MDFVILYEKRSREVEAVIRLKNELEKRGYKVQLAHVSDSFHKKCSSRVLITPFLYGNKEIYECAYGFCGTIDRIVNLQWEQVVCRKYEADSDAWWWPHQEAQKAIHICWGENTKNRLIEAGVSPANAIVTGKIDLDILTRPDLLISKDILASKYSLNKEKKWVLFISSFPYAVYSEAVLDNIKDSTGIDFDELTKVSRTNREIIIKWLLQACRIYDYEFIYRPHPSEECDDIKEAVKYDNFHIICDESIKHWIYNADKVYNWRSTAAIESILLNKGNVVLRPEDYPISEQEDFTIFENAAHIGTEEELIRDLGDAEVTKIKDFLHDYYDREEGKTACERVADVCEHVLNDTCSCHINYEEVKKSLGIRLRMKLYIVHRFGIPFFEKHMKLLDKLIKLHVLKGGLRYALEMRKRDLISEKELRDTEVCLGLARE